MDSTKNKRKNNFVIQGTILAVASILVRLIGLVYRVPLVNTIGNLGMGYYNKAFEIYQLLLILSSFSLPIAVSKLVSVRVSRGKYKDARRIFIGAFLFAVIVGTLSSLIVFYGAEFFSNMIKSPKSVYALKALSPTLLIVAIMGVIRGYFQGKNTMIPTAISQIIEQIVNAVVSVALAIFLITNGPEFGAAGGTIGTGVGALSGLIFLIITYLLARPIFKKSVAKDHSDTLESYQYVFKTLIFTITPIVVSSAVYNVTGIIDMIMSGISMSFHGYSENFSTEIWGIFSGKYKLITTVPIAVASAMSASIIPSITGAVYRGNREEINSKIDIAIRFVMMVAIPASIGIGVLAGPILRLLFNDTDILPAQLLQLGAVAIIFYSMSTISNAILQGINYLNIPVRHSLIGISVKIICNYILLFVFDTNAYGLVISYILFALIVSVLNAVSIKKITQFQHDVKKTFVTPLLAGVVMGAIAFLLQKGLFLLIGRDRISTVIAILLGMIVYLFLFIKLKGINEEELRRIPKGYKLIEICKKIRVL